MVSGRCKSCNDVVQEEELVWIVEGPPRTERTGELHHSDFFALIKLTLHIPLCRSLPNPASSPFFHIYIAEGCHTNVNVASGG